MTDSQIGTLMEGFYGAMAGNEVAERYSVRHGIKSAAILTITDDDRADLVAAYLRDRIEGKVVVEIGGGVGLLACHMAQYARRVIAFEAQPCWAATWVWTLYARKPKNVTYILGAAEELAGQVRGDVAVFCTHSGHDAMRSAAALFAPVVIDVYAEIIEDSPELTAQLWALRNEGLAE